MIGEWTINVTIEFDLSMSRNVDTDLIMQYGRDLQQMRLIVEADSKVNFDNRRATGNK